MNEARKHRDQGRTLLLSTILADLKNREFELQHPVSDEEAAEVVRRASSAAARRPSSTRPPGAPTGPSRSSARGKRSRSSCRRGRSDEIRSAVREAIAAGGKDLGKVMGQVMPKFKGRADGKLVNQIVREELAAAV